MDASAYGTLLTAIGFVSGCAIVGLFLSADLATIMAAPYAVVGDSFRAATPQIWSPASIQTLNLTIAGYDLHPDGRRVATAVARDQGSSGQDKVVFIFNVGDYLRTIAPGTK
jgi:hypothetical protein